MKKTTLKDKKRKAFNRWECKECYAYKHLKGINKCSALKLKKGGILDLTFDEPSCPSFSVLPK